jgi:circadian clock protein KaiB
LSNPEQPLTSLTYKGLALFTPGGDLVYCIDPTKQGYWHVQLCAAIQQIFELPSAPLFLNDCFTATVDRWLDRQTQYLGTVAEVKPLIWSHRPILSTLFDVPLQAWQVDPNPHHCDAWFLDSYRQQFPQLWNHHNLVLNLEDLSSFQYVAKPDASPNLSGYVLRLFISGQTPVTVQALESLHQLLEQLLPHPYTLKIVDVQQYPELAEKDQVTATPTLIKTWPPPVRRLVGALDQIERVRRLLS